MMKWFGVVLVVKLLAVTLLVEMLLETKLFAEMLSSTSMDVLSLLRLKKSS